MKKIVSLLLCLVLCIGCFTPAVVARGEGLQNFVAQNTYNQGQFRDVSSRAWYAESVKVAYELGLVKGDSATSFNPDGNMNVAEAITLACRLHSVYYDKGYDFEQGTPWYQVYVDYAIKNRIIKKNQFTDYEENITRADFALILSASLPDKALPAINRTASVPDVSLVDEKYGDAVYKLYDAGILTGNDDRGTFEPFSTIKRCEVATIVSRMALPSMRKEFTLRNISKNIEAHAWIVDVEVGSQTVVYVSMYKYGSCVVFYPEDQVAVTWGAFEGNTAPLTIYALKKGYSELVFYPEDDPSDFVSVLIHAY